MIPNRKKKHPHKGHKINPKSLLNLRPRQKGDPPRGVPCNGAMAIKRQLQEILESLGAERDIRQDPTGKKIDLGRTKDESVWRMILKLAIEGVPWAVTEWNQYRWGRPVNRIEATGPDGGPIEHHHDLDFSGVPDDKLRVIATGSGGKG